MKVKYLLIMLLTYVLNANSQTGTFYNTDNKLSSNFVNQLFQDNNGLIWICTHNGITVFDGYRFQVFKKGSPNSRELSGNWVNCINQRKDGVIFVGLSTGVQTYYNDHFKSINMYDVSGHQTSCFINSFCNLRNGDMLICTSGYGIMKMVDNNRAESIKKYGTILLYPKKIIEDKSGLLWVVTENHGIFTINKNSINKCKINDDNTNQFVDICQNHRGEIYAASSSNGLYKYDTKQKAFVNLPSSDNLPLASMWLCKNDNILIGTNGQGLFVYNYNSHNVYPSMMYSNNVDLSHSKVYSVIEDKTGNIWTGLLQKGVFMRPTRNTEFSYMGYKRGKNNTIGGSCVMASFQGKDKTVWIATDNDGLYALDIYGNQKHHYSPGLGSSIPSTILAIEEDNDGKLWIGSYRDGCGWIDKNSGVYHRMAFSYGNANNIFDIKADKRGHLWIATLGDGLKMIDSNGSVLREFRNSTSPMLINDYIGQLSLSADGNCLYIGTSTGLSCIDINTLRWIKLNKAFNILNGKNIPDMTEDKNGNLWVGTTDGLFCINKKTGKTTKYDISSGLSDNSVASIRIDSKGFVWVSTGHGINRISPNSNQITNFFAEDGLQYDEFSEGVSLCDNTGRFLFGGTAGIVSFNPLKIKMPKRKLRIMITNVTAGGEIVTSGMESGVYTITDKSISDTDEFQLSHQDNSFSISLSTLTFDNIKSVTYMYSLNNDQWIRLPQGENTISFSHLSPGHYKFKVKAVDNNSESEVKEFSFNIHPAWYFSIWAKLVYLIILFFLGRLYLLNRKRKEQDRLKLQEHIHAEEMSEAKLRFFMNISHEIRTPMTLIVSPLLSLMKEDPDIHRQSIYVVIKRNAERILHLINQMMDLRKIDQGKMTMRMKETDLVEFSSDIYNLFQQQAKIKNINFTLKHDADNILVWLDRDNFDKVLINVLSNAFKFTHAGGEICINITHNDSSVTIAISDDGEKIPEDKLNKIFERFYQSRAVTNNRLGGTGIGLDLTRSLVELHHGTIIAHNNDDKGCTFVITIPMGNAHLKPEEIETEESNSNNESLLYGIDDLNEEKVEEDVIDTTQEVGPFNKKRPKIVLIEDDEEIRTYLNKSLCNEYKIIECCDGKEGYQTVLKEIPAIVISDIMMPEMDGKTMCAKLKNNVNTNHIPIILLTAMSRDEDKLEGLETGADAYIVKPFNLDILRRTIVNLLHARNLLQNKFTGREAQNVNMNDIQIKSPDEKLLERVMNVINENMSNTDLNVDMIAEKVGISRVHLHRKMKQLTNQTPHDLIRNIRLKQAAHLMSTQHQNITEVLYACGFNNTASFSTMFKNLYGMSPSNYMKEHLHNKNEDALEEQN